MPGEMYIEAVEKQEPVDLTSVSESLADVLAKLTAFVVFQGETSGNGAADGSTLICSDLTEKPDYDGNQVVITSGDYMGQARDIDGATNDGILNPHLAFGAQIAAGTKFAILALRTVPAEVAGVVSDVADIVDKLDHATYGLSALNADLDAILADIGDGSASALGSLYAILGNPFVAISTTVQAVKDQVDHATYGLSALNGDLDTLIDRLTAARAGYLDNIAERAKGNLQVASTTIDLNQAAGSYDLFMGTEQDVVVERLLIRLPNVDVSDDAVITSISIQTDDATPQVFISETDGDKTNLTAEAQLGYTGVALIKLGAKIQLTIAGGAADAATVCDVTAEYRATVSGGYLA